MDDEDEWEAEDRETMYLTHAERQVLQRQINEYWNRMIDNIALTPGVRFTDRPKSDAATDSAAQSPGAQTR